MTYKEFQSLRSKREDFKLNDKLTFGEFMCTPKKDGDDIYTMPIPEVVFNRMMTFANEVFLPIRLAWGKHLGSAPGGLMLSSGARTGKSYDRLVAKGYNPSKTSDHFCGYNISNSTTSAGAGDFIPVTGNAKTFFEWLIGHYDRKSGHLILDGVVVKVGQILLEKGNTYWVHLSADRVAYGGKPYSLKVGISEDNGKSFKAI